MIPSHYVVINLMRVNRSWCVSLRAWAGQAGIGFKDAVLIAAELPI
jgi:hypothetical protein